VATEVHICRHKWKTLNRPPQYVYCFVPPFLLWFSLLELSTGGWRRRPGRGQIKVHILDTPTKRDPKQPAPASEEVTKDLSP
jgi:hypothetical protein